MNLLDFAKPDLRDNGVQSYDEFKGEFTYSQRHKSMKFLEYDCLRYIGDNKFICLPLNEETEIKWCGMTFQKTPYITFYNTTTYLIIRDDQFAFRCNCTGFRTKEKRFKSGLSPDIPFCAHIHALLHAFREKRFNHE
jgi:hypothetical protein